MAVNIKVHTVINDISNYTDEDKFAFVLAERFKQEFKIQKYAEGNVALYTNITYGGGDTSESDILIVVDLKNYYVHFTNSGVINDLPIMVEKGCWILELKSHGIDAIMLDGNQFKAKYSDNRGGFIHHPISAQSRKQRFDVKNYFENRLGYSPWIDNFLCFSSISENDLSTLKFDYDNIDPDSSVLGLSREFSFDQMIRNTILYRPNSVKYDRNYTKAWFNSCSLESMFSDIDYLFASEKQIVGELTQKKMAILSLDEARKSTSVSEGKMNVISGRAGTGKTMRLLQIAVDLEDKGNRCLVLTYNHALVSDTRRLLFLTGHHTKLSGKTIDIRTLHSFFLNLMVQLGVRKDKNINIDTYFSSNDGYENDIKLLRHEIENLAKEDLSVYLEIPDCEMNWDYIMIDEGQDWELDEVKILTKIYGEDHIVFADGVDQFIRTSKKLSIKDLAAKKNSITYDVCLRQKNNLVKFVNAFASCSEVSGWKVKSNNKLLGGRVFITTRKKYDSTFHEKIRQHCLDTKADIYDILALVPPQDVRLLETDGKSEKQFAFRDAFKLANIKYFDGTKYSNRSRYSIVGDEMRLYQYESCRGLEGWVTICFDFDLLIEEKKRQFDQLCLYDPDLGGSEVEQKNYYAYLWALMPLTRAVDSLVIVLKDTQGEVANILREIAGISGFRDFIEWNLN